MNRTLNLRRFAAFVAAAVLLTACSSGNGTSTEDVTDPTDPADGSTDAAAPDAESPAPTVGGEVRITHWDFLAPTYGGDMEALLQGYQDVNPEATVVTEGIARQDYETTIQTQLAAGAGPDILAIPDTFLPELAEAGLLEPLDGIFTSENEAGLNDTNEAAIWDGQQVAITWQIAPYAFLYNSEILEQAGIEPPTTFDELVEAAELITEELGITGFAVRHRLAEELPWWIDFNNWPQGFGGGWSDGEQLTIDSEENIAAVTAFKRIYDSGAFAVGDDASTFRSKFAEGQVAMLIDATGLPPAIIGESLPSTTLHSSALPFPGPGTSQVGIFFAINANSENKELARDYLNWFVTQDVQQPLSEMLGNASTMATDTEVPEEFAAENPWVTAYRENAASSRGAVVEGFETATPQIRNIVLSWIERVLLEDVDPAEALGQAQEEATAAVG